MKNMFTIGEMAGLFSVNIRTLRYYDSIGILRPELTDPDTGYRYYSTRQFERLNTIKYLRALDVSLKRIATFFENRDIEVLRRLLEEQREETRARLDDLALVAKKLDSRLAALEDAAHTETDVIREKFYGRREVVFLRRAISLKEDLEYPIRELERTNTLGPMMFLGKVGVSIAAADLRAGRLEQFSGIFVFLEREDRFAGEPQVLPEGDYVTVRFRGTHGGAAKYYKRLLSYMEERGLSLAGDSVEVTLVDAGFTDDTDRYVTEIQIPVEKEGEKKIPHENFP